MKIGKRRHVWSVWSAWRRVTSYQEMRSRHCLDATCGTTQTQWRKVKRK